MNKDGYVLVAILVILIVGGLVFFTGRERAEVEEQEPVIMNDIRVENSMPEPVDQVEEEPQITIVDIAASDPNFSTLVALVQEANLVDTLSAEGPFTVFAPTNEAFAKIPEETLSQIREDQEQLTQILTYHVVEGRVMAEDVANLTSATTLQGGTLNIDFVDDSVMINDATVVQADVEASNGVIHAIDMVLMP